MIKKFEFGMTFDVISKPIVRIAGNMVDMLCHFFKSEDIAC